MLKFQMNWKKFLKPLFALAANPGLGNPHTPYEDELMVAGVKPTALINKQFLTVEMQNIINSGHVVKIAEHCIEKTNRIYCGKEDVEAAKEVAELYDQKGDDFRLYSEDEISLHCHFFSGAIQEYKNGTEHEGLLKGRVKGIFPKVCFDGAEDIIKFDLLVKKGKIASVDFNSEDVMCVFAQADKIEEGKELSRLYYGPDDGEGHQDASDRVGRLLGFTDNDVAWHLGTKYQNLFVIKLMERTNNVRSWARKEYMLMDAPNLEERATVFSPIPPQGV